MSARRLPAVLFGSIFFFAGASTESFDRLWQAHLIEDIGLPSIDGYEVARRMRVDDVVDDLGTDPGDGVGDILRGHG